MHLAARGPFSLAASSRFVEGFVAALGGGDEVRLDLAFGVEGSWRSVGARVEPASDGVRLTVVHNPARVQHHTIAEQVSRILSLDVDGSGFAAVGARDEVVAALQARFPGLRPVQFHSAYEAAAWTIVGHRIRMTQAAAVTARMADELGERVMFDDHEMTTFPGPDALRELGPTRGLTERKVEQLRALGVAAKAGELDSAMLRAMPVDAALAHLQRLPGIGPFSAELVLVRGVGTADVFPAHEARLHRAVGALYGVNAEDTAAVTSVADRWRPYRTWVSVLLRTWMEEETAEIRDGRRRDLPSEVTVSAGR